MSIGATLARRCLPSARGCVGRGPVELVPAGVLGGLDQRPAQILRAGVR